MEDKELARSSSNWAKMRLPPQCSDQNTVDAIATVRTACLSATFSEFHSNIARPLRQHTHTHTHTHDEQVCVQLPTSAVNVALPAPCCCGAAAAGERTSPCSSLHRALGWLGSRVVSVLDSGAEGPGFKSQSRRCRVTVLGKLFTPIVPLFTKQLNW